METMNILIDELSKTPEYLVQEVLDFLLFIKQNQQQQSISEDFQSETTYQDKVKRYLDSIDRDILIHVNKLDIPKREERNAR